MLSNLEIKKEEKKTRILDCIEVFFKIGSSSYFIPKEKKSRLFFWDSLAQLQNEKLIGNLVEIAN
jgi:hypothetical protein